MESSAIIAAVVAAIGALVIGIFLGKMIFAKNTKKEVEEAEIQSKKIIEDAKTLGETLKEKKLLEAKEHFLQLKTNHDKDVQQRNQKLVEGENRLKQQQQAINDKTATVQKQSQENDQIKENLERQVLAPLTEAAAQGEMESLEEAARGLRRLELAGRQLGGEEHYDRMLRTAARQIGEDGPGSLVERARLVEILAGSEAALALLRR